MPAAGQAQVGMQGEACGSLPSALVCMLPAPSPCWQRGIWAPGAEVLNTMVACLIRVQPPFEHRCLDAGHMRCLIKHGTRQPSSFAAPKLNSCISPQSKPRQMQIRHLGPHLRLPATDALDLASQFCPRKIGLSPHLSAVIRLLKA